MIWILIPIVAIAGVGFAVWLGAAVAPESGEGSDEAEDVAEQETSHFVE
jgi:hypothetical protein